MAGARCRAEPVPGAHSVIALNSDQVVYSSPLPADIITGLFTFVILVKTDFFTKVPVLLEELGLFDPVFYLIRMDAVGHICSELSITPDIRGKILFLNSKVKPVMY